MKSKARRAGLVPLILSALALLLAVAAVWAAPAAVAKYATAGQGRGSVQVAGWNPVIMLGTGEIRLSPFNTAANNATKKQIFEVWNNSDVTADFTIMVEHRGGWHSEISFRSSPPTPVYPLSTGLPEVIGFVNYLTGDSNPTVRLAPGGMAAFEIEFQYKLYDNPNDVTRTYSVVCYAVQVD